MKRNLLYLLLAVSLLSGCSFLASSPPNLSPAATTAWNQTRVRKSLDVIRDTAQDGCKITPVPVIKCDDAVIVTKWHRSSLIIMDSAGSGWPNQIKVSIDELLKNLPPYSRNLLSPYVQLSKILIDQVNNK